MLASTRIEQQLSSCSRRGPGPLLLPARRQTRLRLVAEQGKGGGRAGSSSGGSEGENRRQLSSRQGGRRKKARSPGLFEVQDVSPPPRSLGIHALPPVRTPLCLDCLRKSCQENTHNGDQIEVAGSSYVVKSLCLQYKLVRGKYKREHARLDVENTGRMLANLYLENLYQKESAQEPPAAADGPTGC